MAWMTKQEYANKIGRSIKSVERKVADGTLASYCRPDGKRLVWAQPGSETSTEVRLERIEEKLDELLRRRAPGARAAAAAPARKKTTTAAAAPTPTTRTKRVKRKVAAKAAELAEDPSKAPDHDAIIERINNFWKKGLGRSSRNLAEIAEMPKSWLQKAMQGSYRTEAKWINRWHKLDLTLKRFEQMQIHSGT